MDYIIKNPNVTLKTAKEDLAKTGIAKNKLYDAAEKLKEMRLV